jgi:hypothetical protein
VALSGSDDNSTDGGLPGSLRRALEHAEGAVRCYLAILAAEARRLVRLSMREAVWLAALLGVGFIGLTLLAFGLATFIGSHLDVPGAGFMIVGGVMVAAFLVIMFVVKAREER